MDFEDNDTETEKIFHQTIAGAFVPGMISEEFGRASVFYELSDAVGRGRRKDGDWTLKEKVHHYCIALGGGLIETAGAFYIGNAIINDINNNDADSIVLRGMGYLAIRAATYFGARSHADAAEESLKEEVARSARRKPEVS
jgi:hypothetical protein